MADISQIYQQKMPQISKLPDVETFLYDFLYRTLVTKGMFHAVALKRFAEVWMNTIITHCFHIFSTTGKVQFN